MPAKRLNPESQKQLREVLAMKIQVTMMVHRGVAGESNSSTK